MLAPNLYPTEWQAWIRRYTWRVLSRNAPYLHSLFVCMQTVIAGSHEHRLLIAPFLRLVRRGERRRGEGECKYTACFFRETDTESAGLMNSVLRSAKRRWGAAYGGCWSWSYSSKQGMLPNRVQHHLQESALHHQIVATSLLIDL